MVLEREFLETEKWVINFEQYDSPDFSQQKSLTDFLGDIIALKTEPKWDTWSRTYLEIPQEVLINFGIISNLPLTVYLNMVYGKPFYYCYGGSILSGDAAWFDKGDFIKIPQHHGSFIKANNALINREKLSFLDYFDQHDAKWHMVPVENEKLAEIARNFNKHLK